MQFSLLRSWEISSTIDSISESGWGKSFLGLISPCINPHSLASQWLKSTMKLREREKDKLWVYHGETWGFFQGFFFYFFRSVKKFRPRSDSRSSIFLSRWLTFISCAREKNNRLRREANWQSFSRESEMLDWCIANISSIAWERKVKTSR